MDGRSVTSMRKYGLKLCELLKKQELSPLIEQQSEFYKKLQETSTNCCSYYKREVVSLKIEVVPRFRIEGKYYTAEELSSEKVREIILNRIDLAMSGMNYERKKTA